MVLVRAGACFERSGLFEHEAFEERRGHPPGRDGVGAPGPRDL
jgi:hypothetical protein